MQNRTSVNRFGVDHCYGTDHLQLPQRLTAYEKYTPSLDFSLKCRMWTRRFLRIVVYELVDVYNSDMDLQQLILECHHFKHYTIINQNIGGVWF